MNQINGVDIHEWAVEQVATELCMAAVTVRDISEHEAVMRCAVHFAELYWREKMALAGVMA